MIIKTMGTRIVNYLNHIKFILLFLIVIVFYCLYYGLIGYDDADGGYTLALSWRIFNGEIAYRDFIMVRPPLSPLFHSILLYIIPENYQLIFDRFFMYLLFASSSLFGALTLDNVFQLKKLKLHPYLLATIGFVFSVGNFPPLAWHAVDAVFFASIGIYILVCCSSLYSVCFGVLFLFLSALCKQPFYLMPLAGFVFVSIIHKDWKRTMASIFSLLVFISAFFLLLYKQGTVANFIDLTTGSTKLEDLLSAGIFTYFNIPSLYILLPFAVWLIARKHVVFKYLSIKEDFVPYFFISINLVVPLTRFIYVLLFKEVPYSFDFSFIDSTAKALFLITVFFSLANLSKEKKWVTLCFLIIVSWCSGISWSYQTPILFSTPLIVGFLLTSNQYFEVKKTGQLAIYILLLGSITYFIAYQKPYCNPMRHELTCRIDYLFPKLKYIKVSTETHDKYKEFAWLVSKYGDKYPSILPRVAD